MFETVRSRRLLLWTLILLIGLFLYQLNAVRQSSVLSVRVPPLLIASAPLRLGQEAVSLIPVNIRLNEPVELDGKTRAEVFALRNDYVLKENHLIKGRYRPSPAIFGQITDGKPWWGLMGQYCNGPGEKSIEGASEESRFLANPFLLLGVNENMAWTVNGSCFPVYPRPISLEWDAANKMATVTYDMSRFFKEWSEVPPRAFGPSYYLVNYNARDFGFNYVAAVKKFSYNIKPLNKARLFKEPIYLRAFIHAGGSCGYPGRCNNQSPAEGDIEFWVPKLPARMECKLWKKRPADINQPADFTFVLKFE